MREMLEKVPEGDWLCEECKDAEETEKKKLGKSELSVECSISIQAPISISIVC